MKLANHCLSLLWRMMSSIWSVRMCLGQCQMLLLMPVLCGRGAVLSSGYLGYTVWVHCVAWWWSGWVWNHIVWVRGVYFIWIRWSVFQSLDSNDTSEIGWEEEGWVGWKDLGLVLCCQFSRCKGFCCVVQEWLKICISKYLNCKWAKVLYLKVWYVVLAFSRRVL